MRFVKYGPDIPDELLIARDQGRVVFFCGAGVSRAKVGLPDFFGLARNVINSLKDLPGSRARKVLKEAEEIFERTKVPGLISADRLFSLLEQDFPLAEIEKAVAQELKAKGDVDLSAHQILLDLATTPEGFVRLATTNFDRYFSDCKPKLTHWLAPPLPPSDFNGIVYLHGRASEDYLSAEGDGFILSSSEFGRAYLSEGWATNFIKDILEKYVVVFVGYTADDPPVHYLLEALSKDQKNMGIYAFQDGTDDEVCSKWEHKGVHGVAYSPDDRHKALWDTLDAWAARAKDIDGWYDEVIRKSLQGPRALTSTERGQVAHVVSSTDGVNKFAQFKQTPPAEWLCVFDKNQRFTAPAYQGENIGSRELVDPFGHYCLDSDPVPTVIIDKTPASKITRKLPPDVWNAFDFNDADTQEQNQKHLSFLQGGNSSSVPPLFPRLNKLADWISKNLADPVALWWLVRQGEIHPKIVRELKWRIRLNKDQNIPPEIYRAWHYLIEFWEGKPDQVNDKSESIVQKTEVFGWSEALAQGYANCWKPRIDIGTAHYFSACPPFETDKVYLHQLMHLELVYEQPLKGADIPDKYLAGFLSALRGALTATIELEEGIGWIGMSDFTPITQLEEDKSGYPASALSLFCLTFSKYFTLFIEADLKAAQREFLLWASKQHVVFAMLSFWGARSSAVVSDNDFVDLLQNDIDKEYFWDHTIARELLLTLKARWQDLSKPQKQEIEGIIIEGPPPLEGRSLDENKKRSAWLVLDKLHWLNQHECSLTFDLDALTTQLKQLIPDWDKSSTGDQLIAHRTGGIVKTYYDCSALYGLNLDEILAAAETEDNYQDDFLKENQPFEGFSNQRPMRAFRCLRLAAGKNEFPIWAWNAFFSAHSKENTKPKLFLLIAKRLSAFDEAVMLKLLIEVIYWLEKIQEPLIHECRKEYFHLISKIFSTIQTYSEECSKLLAGGESTGMDFYLKSINTPVGSINRILVNDPRVTNLASKVPFPESWIQNLEKLLQLGGDVYKYTLCICSRNLSWFYSRAPEWTKMNIVKHKNDSDDGLQEAFWAGLLSSGIPSVDAYTLIKPEVLNKVCSTQVLTHEDNRSLAAIILFGWADENVELDDLELSEVLVKGNDEFRQLVLFHAEIWIREPDNEWLGQLIKLLRDAWPRHKAAKSPLANKQLSELVFASEEIFEHTHMLIQPLLVQRQTIYAHLQNLQQTKEKIINRWPEKVLSILDVILPSEVAHWSYTMDEIFTLIEKSDPALKKDIRLVEMKRKWNSR